MSIDDYIYLYRVIGPSQQLNIEINAELAKKSKDLVKK